ncbi:MAG: hypothetical protein IKA88_01450 [Clostridia bacterium]|nr:hypothetical protein [Clostridia bacterium]
MKKIGLLAATLTAVTVGGVYAAWTYAEADVIDISSTEQIVSVAGIDTTQNLKVGSLAIKASDDFAIVIDSAAELGLTGQARPSGNGTYHQHEAVLSVTGSITVTFTPTPQASDLIHAKGLRADLYFTIPSHVSLSNIVWGEPAVQIIEFNEFQLRRKLGETTDTDGKRWQTPTETGEGYFAYTYTTEELKQLFTLDEGLIIDSIKTHKLFSDELAGLTTTLHVVQVDE